MVSEKQLLANRANALKSTGPTTPEGKIRASQNSLKHGLTARFFAILPTEDPYAYQAFCDEVREHLEPRSAPESILVDRIAQLMWRQQRGPNAEAEIINIFQKNHPEPQTGSFLMAEAFVNLDDWHNPLQRLQRYESSVDRQLNRALAQYAAMQKEHRNNPRTYHEPCEKIPYPNPTQPYAKYPPEPNNSTSEQNEPIPATGSQIQNEPIPATASQIQNEPIPATASQIQNEPIPATGGQLQNEPIPADDPLQIEVKTGPGTIGPNPHSP